MAALLFFGMLDSSRHMRSNIALASYCSAAISACHPLSSEVSLLWYMAMTALPFSEKASGGVEKGLCRTGCQSTLEETIRTSRINNSVISLRNRVYSPDGFMEHFQWCPKAQALWKLSNEGTVLLKYQNLSGVAATSAKGMLSCIIRRICRGQFILVSTCMPSDGML